MHAPSSDYSDADTNRFYKDVRSVMKREAAHIKVIIGDPNTKVGGKLLERPRKEIMTRRSTREMKEDKLCYRPR